ncbi:hypothetical protein C8R45DRAFT_162916 [Mycena sanguinolenta]|nr:hypothetical protein C8R45DRAFT_162916 [Mycena sanguinolenta]
MDIENAGACLFPSVNPSPTSDHISAIDDVSTLSSLRAAPRTSHIPLRTRAASFIVWLSRLPHMSSIHTASDWELVINLLHSQSDITIPRLLSQSDSIPSADPRSSTRFPLLALAFSSFFSQGLARSWYYERWFVCLTDDHDFLVSFRVSLPCTCSAAGEVFVPPCSPSRCLISLFAVVLCSESLFPSLLLGCWAQAHTRAQVPIYLRCNAPGAAVVSPPWDWCLGFWHSFAPWSAFNDMRESNFSLQVDPSRSRWTHLTSLCLPVRLRSRSRNEEPEHFTLHETRFCTNLCSRHDQKSRMLVLVSSDSFFFALIISYRKFSAAHGAHPFDLDSFGLALALTHLATAALVRVRPRKSMWTNVCFARRPQIFQAIFSSHIVGKVSTVTHVG